MCMCFFVVVFLSFVSLFSFIYMYALQILEEIKNIIIIISYFPKGGHPATQTELEV